MTVACNIPVDGISAQCRINTPRPYSTVAARCSDENAHVDELHIPTYLCRTKS